jgi:hypothetical protein
VVELWWIEHFPRTTSKENGGADELKFNVASVGREENLNVQPSDCVQPSGYRLMSLSDLHVIEKMKGSSGRTRTYNPPVNSRMLCH